MSWDMILKTYTEKATTNMMNELRDKIYQNAVSKGFWDKERNMGEALMLVVTELAEALEVHRASGQLKEFTEGQKLSLEKMSDEQFPETFSIMVKDSFHDEMADVLIRVLDLCGGYNIDIDWHIKMKMRYNATRARLHGKKY
jgi:NTP pyrophosphatase (non-canonical NTP hydrolase)